jgi:hypothetical protein
MDLQRGHSVRIHQAYTDNHTSRVPAGTVGTVTSTHLLDRTMRYVVEFGRVEAVLYRADLERVTT